ncbi:MAG: sulfatase-like hydrolase/transferase [Anaerolineae bacterium]|jgi:arylsulfatase A-like enzyme|nr:sulfatase-like hydrolase/transferase [Anaerolineae bacterium]
MSKPNILIVMTDHQRADTSFADHPSITPHLDQLAKNGLTFTNAYCPSPHCCPSRATFFSGLYPSQHGIWNNICNRMSLGSSLKEGVRLWSEDLAEAGFQQHYVGKWHVSITQTPKDVGWKEYTVSGTGFEHHGMRWDQYKELAKQPEKTERAEGEILRQGYPDNKLYWTSKRKDHTHDERVLEETLAILHSLEDSDQPWVVYSGFIGPHDPYIAPQEFLDLYDIEDIQLPESYADELEDKPRVVQRMREQIFGQLTPYEYRQAIRHFYAYCSYLDDCFGQILEALEATGQAEDTIVIYTSDHGDYAGEHGLFAKGIPCYQGAYHIPVVIRWPNGLEQPDRLEDAFVSLADFAPTFLDLVGIKTDRHFAGQSLMPYIKGSVPEKWRDAIFTQCNGVEQYYTQRSVMTKEWKYVFNGFDQDELYHLTEDPEEMHNLSNDPAYRDTIKMLCRKMWQFAYENDDALINPYITVGLAPFGPAEAFHTD